MNILYYGQLKETGVKLCNSLSELGRVVAVCPCESDYDLECTCVLKKDAVMKDLLREFRPELLLVYGEDDLDCRELYQLMSDSAASGVKRALILKEAPFYRRVRERADVDLLLCREFSARGLPSSVLECSALYGDVTPPRYVSRLVAEYRQKGRVLAAADDPFCDALHVDDLCAFLRELISHGFDGTDAVTCIQSGYPFRLETFLALFSRYFPRANIVREEEHAPEEDFLPYSAAHWSPKSCFPACAEEAFRLAEEACGCRTADRRAGLFSGAGRIGLLALAFAALELYLHFIPVASELQFVDLRLLLIVCAGLFYGKTAGIVTAAACSVSSIVHTLRANVVWYVLFYHVDNWIPIAVYFIAAILIGTYHDKLKETVRTE